MTGAGYVPLALCSAPSAGALLRRGRRGLLAGLALGAVAAATWMAAGAAGYGYGLGFVGAAEGTLDGGALPFQLWLALGVIAGGAALGERRLWRPDTRARRAPPPAASCWAPAAASRMGATSVTG